MPNKINIPSPPPLGAEDRELYAYLFKLAEQLNVCLASIDADHSDINERLKKIEEVR